MSEVHLTAPLTEADARNLKLGDIVYITGKVFLCMTSFHVRVAEQNAPAPFDTNEYNVMWLSGLVATREGDRWKALSAGATTSMRYEKWEPAVIERAKLRAIIGKGGMGKGTLEALRRFGCVHLGKLGMMTGALYGSCIKNIDRVHWIESGMGDAVWNLTVQDLGPTVVDMDAHGNVLYDAMFEKQTRETIPMAYRRLGLEPRR